MTKKLYTKTFEHKGQMVNYYNKVRVNENIGFCCCGLSAQYGKYYVSYEYK